MDCIILNSGFGSRLKQHCDRAPKGLVPISDTDTILGRQLRLLGELGFQRFAVTTGYLDGKIQEYCSREFPALTPRYFTNQRYATTNYIASLELLRGSVDGEVMLMHGDLVFERSVAGDVAGSNGSVIVVDTTLPLPDKDFKARIRAGRVVEIGVDVFGSDCYACQALYKLEKADWNLWQQAIHRFCQEGIENVYAENALNTVTDRINLRPLDVAGRLCMEVDNEDDLMLARSRIVAENRLANGE